MAAIPELFFRTTSHMNAVVLKKPVGYVLVQVCCRKRKVWSPRGHDCFSCLVLYRMLLSRLSTCKIIYVVTGEYNYRKQTSNKHDTRSESDSRSQHDFLRYSG